MKLTIVIGALFTLVDALGLASGCFLKVAYARSSVVLEPGRAKQIGVTTAPRPVKKQIERLRIVSFRLKDSGVVKGKVISEDRHMITLEKPDESRIVLFTYDRKDIDSIVYETMPEFEYYENLAEYFSNRTGDFKDDPDDFIQAIRFYEKSKRLIAETRGETSEQVKEIEEKIKEIKADREVWIKEVKSRAELKKLEFEAMFDVRIKELEKEINKTNEELYGMAKDIKGEFEKIKDSNKNLSWELEKIKDILSSRPRNYYYYYPYYRHRDGESDKNN